MKEAAAGKAGIYRVLGARHRFDPADERALSMRDFIEDEKETLAIGLAPAGVAGSVRPAIRGLDPSVPMHDVGTMEARLADSVADPRRLTWLVGVFAAVAGLLAALGVFGVMSYAVARRRREIGVRIAVGADRGAILGMVVRRGVLRAAAGLAAGVLLSLLGARTLEAMLFGGDATDPVPVAAAAALLLAVAFAACWLPGLRAARTDPVAVLGAE